MVYCEVITLAKQVLFFSTDNFIFFLPATDMHIRILGIGHFLQNRQDTHSIFVFYTTINSLKAIVPLKFFL